MPLPTESRSILKKLLTVVTQRAFSLLEILDKEYDALLEVHPGELADITTHKIKALSELETADQVLQDFLTPLGAGPGGVVIEHILEDCPECAQRWHILTKALNQLREHNLRNGAVLNKNQQRTTQIITIITGREQLTEYTRQGGIPLELSSRSLAKA